MTTGGPQELSGDRRNSSGSEELVSTTVYVLLHLHWVGSVLSPGALACLQGCCSVFWDTSSELIWARTKRMKRALLRALACQPTWGCSGSAGQYPTCPKHPLSSYLPAQITLHAQSIQNPILHKTAFSRLEETATLFNSHKQIQKVKQNEKTEEYLLNE